MGRVIEHGIWCAGIRVFQELWTDLLAAWIRMEDEEYPHHQIIAGEPEELEAWALLSSHGG